MEFITHRVTQIRGVLRRAFGCWHLDLSLPFTRNNESYRTCVTCGARRRFDLERWTMIGDFYQPESRYVCTQSPVVNEVLSWKFRNSISLDNKRTTCHRKQSSIQ